MSTRPYRFFDLVLLSFFIVVMLVGGGGVIKNRHRQSQEQEQRVAAAWPTTNANTLYQEGWRQAVTAFVNDRFGYRGTLVAINNTIAVSYFHTSPKLTPKPAYVIATSTPAPNPTSEIPTSPNGTAVPVPTTTEPTAPTTVNPTPPKETITPTLAPAWKEQNVVVGKHGWLFLDQQGAIDDYRCRVPFTAAELSHIITYLTTTQAKLAKQHIVFTMMIAPDKPAVYAEELPNEIKPLGTTCRMDQVVNAVRTKTTIPILDPRPLLREKKQDTAVYSKTDSHWNDIGAFATYRAFIASLQSSYPTLQPLAWTDFTQRTKTVPGLDLAKILSIEKTTKEDLIQLIPNEPRQAVLGTADFKDPEPSPTRNTVVYDLPGSTAPRLLVLRDSFTGALMPFFAETFSRTTAVWTYNALPDIVAAEHPNIVVLEIAQRLLNKLTTI